MLGDLWTFGRQQVIIAVIASLIILFLQLRWGVIPRELTFYGFLSVALPYLGIIALAFIFHAVRAPWIIDKDRQRRANKLRGRIRKQRQEVEALDSELSEIREYKLTAIVVHTSSYVFADTEHITLNCPVINVKLVLRFKNHAPQDMAIEDLDVMFCERNIDNEIFQVVAQGDRPRTLYYRTPEGGRAQTDIAGLVVKGFGLSPEYTFVWQRMTLIDEPYLKPTNGQHFLRLTLRAVIPQKPFVVDIGVDWENPASYIWWKAPVDD
jgi:hypothetical protein